MKSLISIFVAIIIVIVGLSVYLAPNDLAQCSFEPSDIPGCGKVDAIVAVSGGDTPARTKEAIDLYQAGWSDTLVFSGAAQDKSGPSNAEAMKLQAVAAGVPKQIILIEGNSETTRQNAEQTQALLTKYDIHKVILVTSAYHQRRASLEFNKRAGGTVTILNHPVARDSQWSGAWWLTPIGWWLAIGECFKIAAFYLGGSR